MFHVLGTSPSAPPPTLWHFLGFYLSGSDLSLDVGDSAFFMYSHKLGLHLYLFGRNFSFSTRLCPERGELGLQSGNETEVGTCCIKAPGSGFSGNWFPQKWKQIHQSLCWKTLKWVSRDDGKSSSFWDFLLVFVSVLCLVLPEWAFGRDSWIHYEPRSTRSARSTRVQLMVRTRISRSTLLSLASADGSGYMRLEVGAPKALLLQSSSFVMEYPNRRRRCSFWLRTPIYNVIKSTNSPHEGSCSYLCCENKAQPEDCFVLLACSLCFYLSLAIKLLSTYLFLLKEKKKKKLSGLY